MSPERKREIARMGGKATPAYARSFRDKTLAQRAGRLGGLKSQANRRARRRALDPNKDQS